MEEKKRSPGTKETAYWSIHLLFKDAKTVELIKVVVLNCLKEFNLHPTPKQRSTPEESQGSSGGIIANTLTKVQLILQLQK